MHRYTVTDYGLRIALFYTRSHARVARAGLAVTLGAVPSAPIRKALLRLERTIDEHCEGAKLAA